MNRSRSLKLAILVVLSIVTPTLAAADSDTVSSQDVAILAATAGPAVMLEKSQSHALDDYVKAFRTPIMNSKGEIKYYDVTIKLTVNSDGTLKKTAKVTATPSPVIINGALVPGTYQAADGTTCTVTNITLSNGRIQSFASCLSAEAKEFNLSVATGLLTDGHPFLKELTAQKIDQRLDANTYTWGLLTSSPYYLKIGNCNPNNCTGEALGAHTDGKVLILSFFYNDAFVCSAILTKQE